MKAKLICVLCVDDFIVSDFVSINDDSLDSRQTRQELCDSNTWRAAFGILKEEMAAKYAAEKAKK